jgi:hypothetical protein
MAADRPVGEKVERVSRPVPACLTGEERAWRPVLREKALNDEYRRARRTLARSAVPLHFPSAMEGHAPAYPSTCLTADERAWRPVLRDEILNDKYRRRDSNPHFVGNSILNRARLPFRHTGFRLGDALILAAGRGKSRRESMMSDRR